MSKLLRGIIMKFYCTMFWQFWKVFSAVHCKTCKCFNWLNHAVPVTVQITNCYMLYTIYNSGWAATSLFNKDVQEQLMKFKERPNTFSLGVCNGCQLMGLLGWVAPDEDLKGIYFLYWNKEVKWNLSEPNNFQIWGLYWWDNAWLPV